jgi:transposase-like protein
MSYHISTHALDVSSIP